MKLFSWREPYRPDREHVIKTRYFNLPFKVIPVIATMHLPSPQPERCLALGVYIGDWCAIVKFTLLLPIVLRPEVFPERFRNTRAIDLTWLALNVAAVVGNPDHIIELEKQERARLECKKPKA